jgi:hypothetical protein
MGLPSPLPGLFLQLSQDAAFAGRGQQGDNPLHDDPDNEHADNQHNDPEPRHGSTLSPAKEGYGVVALAANRNRMSNGGSRTRH